MFDLVSDREARVISFMMGLGWEDEQPKRPCVKHLPKDRSRYLKYHYNLTTQQYQDLVDNQSGHCAMCTSTEFLCVDHDHACCPGRRSCGACIRGILCSECNTMLGKVKEDVERMRSAIAYLTEPTLT